MKTIAICNHKGGVGKTALSMAIAEGLHRNGKRTLLVDLDQQMNATQQAKDGKKIKVDTGPVIERIDNLFTDKLFTGAKTFTLFLGDLRLLPFFLFLQGGDLAIDVFDTLWHGTFLSFGYYSSPSSF
ncbi:MAG: ParA family protein [Oscillospiraceae bacterium]